MFLSYKDLIETEYKAYCKTNDAAIQKLQELSQPSCPEDVKQFFKTCQLKLQGKTSGIWIMDDV